MINVFLDTETTGLKPGNIAQLAMIIEDESGKLDAKNYYFEVDSMEEGAEKACNRGVDFYRQASGGMRFSDKANEICSLLKDTRWIAHNIKFDKGFISTELWRQHLTATPQDMFDTMLYFKNICKIPDTYKRGFVKNPRLEEMVNFFKINTEEVAAYTKELFSDAAASTQFHDAMYDTTSMFIAMHVYGDTLYNRTAWIERFTL